ncbi:ATP-dependent RNA helicase kurz-like protein [Sarcoptes scabiei]|uniref:RNA helicase n=1 Tax=Sarcoptes scabiei TaxID=52283 RepID=A0A132AE77_SARSC|nr:ATP-dependent RNA helicase kurz-like protein [Sarcoptes scabiei]
MPKSKSMVTVDFDVDETKYDESNRFILLKDNGVDHKESKTKQRSKKEAKLKSQLLSKKKRKKLEKILERKNRKFNVTNRANLIDELRQYQLKDSEYNQMPTTSVIQTVGKRKIDKLLELYNSINNDNSQQQSGEASKFSHKKYKIQRVRSKNNEKNFFRNDPSVLGFDKDSETCSSDDDEIEREEQEEIKTTLDKIPRTITNEEDLSVEIITNHENFKADVEEKNDQNDENVKKAEFSEKNVSIVTESVTQTTTKPEEKIKTVFVQVDRSEEIQKLRLKLPILCEEHTVMDAINHNRVVIICGETGSGKTTQVPQFLYEAGYALNDKKIAITEPRRVAAISMSKRVAYEMNLTESEVSYQIRYEGNVSDRTRIKFMTDGILLKEIESDFLLKQYSAVVIDEAHERSLFSDILIGFLSKISEMRYEKGDPLKLIIMSATLKIEEFIRNSRLFSEPPPVIKINSRQYPVTVHYAKRTNPNYLHEAYKTVCKIHSHSPPGSILVFVTGRNEVQYLVRMLKNKFPMGQHDKFVENLSSVSKESQENSTDENHPSTIHLDSFSVDPIENEEEDAEETDEKSNNSTKLFINDSDEDEEFEKTKNDSDESDNDDCFLEDDGWDLTKEPLYCLPFYSMLSNEKQMLIFKKPPANCRLCVIATNVAETSLTIPNIKYVIDTGKVKNKLYDKVTSVSTFLIEWISKASANQRSGRAGRTSAGHCYRLYSSAVYNDFIEHPMPEILSKPVDNLYLQLKAIGIEDVGKFPFVTRPEFETLKAAEKRLLMLGALERKKFLDLNSKALFCSKITSLGQVMANFPVHPRYSKMLCLSIQSNLMPYSLAIISAFTVQELFASDIINDHREGRKISPFFSSPLCQTLGDLMPLLEIFHTIDKENFSRKFCEIHGLRYKAVVEMKKLRQLLQNALNRIDDRCYLPQFQNQLRTISLNYEIPNEIQIKNLRQLFICCFPDHIAKQIKTITTTETNEDGEVIKKVKKSVKNCYQTIEVEDFVYIPSQSILFNENFEYVVYQEIFESGKLFMRNVVPIESEWLPLYAKQFCSLSSPLNDPGPRYDSKDDQIKCFRSSTFGPLNWEMPSIEMEYPNTIEKFCFFAHFLFKGSVIEWFGNNIDHLNSSTIVFTKSWAMIQPKAEKVVKLLMNNKICSKKALIERWKSNKNCEFISY